MFLRKPPFQSSCNVQLRVSSCNEWDHHGPTHEDKFLVINLRGADRPFIVEWMTSSYLIRKIESFNITNFDIIYRMKDLKRELDNVTNLKQHFEDSLLMASVVETLSKSPCEEDKKIVFATELALEKLSDGFLSFSKNRPDRSCMQVLEDFWCCIHFLLQNDGCFLKIFQWTVQKIYAFSMQHTNFQQLW